ncbi:hypothetical protein [Saccharothrix australiensis]|uniref:hypothetical protein n=1 Tax=Saccharothrix australiensis TaxID=2072 RepID=UPI0011C3C016|nr:hypothetical protein [Saccharothrix australiensis]
MVGAGTAVLTSAVGADDVRVRIECRSDDLDSGVGEGPFDATCLGRVQAWRPASRELVVRPIALFQ